MTNRENAQSDDDELDGLIEIQSIEEIPKFQNEDEEDAFWATHSVAPHLFRGRGFRPGSAAERIYERRRRTEAGPPEVG